MATRKKNPRAKRSSRPSSGMARAAKELKQLRASVKSLKTQLMREAKRRQIAAKLTAAAKKARQAINQQVVKLGTEGRKLAGELKTALAKAKRHEVAWRDAQSQVRSLSAELKRKDQELARKNAEIERLSGELAQKSSTATEAAAPVAPAAPAAEEPTRQNPLFPSETSRWNPSGGSGTA
jgi:chromosome segregation ATPase